MKVCIFTGTRAEYGLLKPLLTKLIADSRFDTRILASGAHLSPEFGKTCTDIEEQDRLVTVEMLLSSDTSVGVAKSFGLGVIGFSDALAAMSPDWAIVAGDRYEALAFVSTCVILGIPVAHIHGGEISEGSLDEYFRHAISKLSRLHFVSTSSYGSRLVRMGEQPEMVHNVGAIGLDNLASVRYMDKDELQGSLGIRFAKRNFLVTYHPVHGSSAPEVEQATKTLLLELDRLEDAFFIVTKANADANGRVINAVLQQWASSNPRRAALFDSLGTARYFSVMRMCDAVVGNSSSGLIEAPSFRVPTVNVGRRQAGRIRAGSVVDCPESAVSEAIRKCLSADFQRGLASLQNPYGNGGTADKIIDGLLNARLPGPVKIFYDGESNI